MAWESRGNHGRRYYYSAKRRNGKVVKTFHGGGVTGILAADAIEQDRCERSEEAETLRANVARLEPPESALEALVRATSLMLEAELVARGYWRVNHGPWRRRRWSRTTN